ncbi:MAG: PTS glucose transporter subunit IIA [Longibaculum sp.]
MFNILKKKKTIVAPVSGQVIPLSDVKDEVFSSGMMGDGIAIQPTDDIFVAPCDGGDCIDS